MRVAEILDAETYVARNGDQFAAVPAHPEFRRLEPYLDSAEARAFWLLRLWLAEHPEVDALCPGEATEVVLAAEATALRLDRVVPPAIVTTLRWQSGPRPERSIKHLGELALL